MDSNFIVLIFLYGQLWWSPLSAEIKESAYSSSPSHLYPTSKYGYLIKNERGKATPEPSSTVKPSFPAHHDPHLLAAVIIGVILLSMIITMVAIFLWKRWKHTRESQVLHWAGRSPFADGDTPDVMANKEPSMKRTSVLSLLPWKFNKDTQLLDSDEGQLSESRENMDVLSSCKAEETVGQSSPIAEPNFISSTSTETLVCDTPSTPVEGPLQPTIPEPLDLPPPPNWLSGVNGELCPTSDEPRLPPPEENANSQCSVVPNLIHQNLGEELLLPPPPEDFI